LHPHLEDALASSVSLRRDNLWRRRPDSNPRLLDRQSRTLVLLSCGRSRVHEGATSFPVCKLATRNFWWVWKDSNPQCSRSSGVTARWGDQLPQHTHIWRRGREPNAQAPSGASRFRPDRLAHAEPLQKLLAVAARVERASPLEERPASDGVGLTHAQRYLYPSEKTCRRGRRFVAAGAGFEPAHASQREPRFRRGAIPFRSSCPSNRLAETIRLERMAPFKGRAALAVRCLNPTQPRLLKTHWWGWRESNSHAQGAGF
jgi:hypothetical protein